MPPSFKRPNGSTGLRFPFSFLAGKCAPYLPPDLLLQRCGTRSFHDYFVTHLPSSSLHPDSRSAAGPGHRLPRDQSTPHSDKQVSPAQIAPVRSISRELTVVRIPLKSAKHHFGATCLRGTRPYNEDTHQAGTIDLPAFAQRAPVSLVAGRPRASSMNDADDTQREGASTPAGGVNGDPQVFYFSVFDGHGGDKCSIWLRSNLHLYLERAAKAFELKSSLGSGGASTESKVEPKKASSDVQSSTEQVEKGSDVRSSTDKATKDSDVNPSTEKADKASEPRPSTEQVERDSNARSSTGQTNKSSNVQPSTEQAGTSSDAQPPTEQTKKGLGSSGGSHDKELPTANDNIDLSVGPDQLQTQLIESWGDTVGGYFKRFKPEFFPEDNGGQGFQLLPSKVRNSTLLESPEAPPLDSSSSAKLETVLNYAFLRSDLDFSTSQAAETHTHASNSMADPVALGRHSHHSEPLPFLGGSTGSVALLSTPTAVPFWAPSSPFTLVTAHIGDTRILLCSTSSGAPIPLTSNHHPSLPSESGRLRRYGGAVTTDSFGEERVLGLANTRSFGDARSKRVGVSAEPELRMLHSRPGEFSFLVLASDGVTGTLNDQEIVDIVKEAKTPEQASRDVVSYATEVGAGEKGDADNATCMVVRLGGWERRSEGGGGGLNTREEREWRKKEATQNFRGGRT